MGLVHGLRHPPLSTRILSRGSSDVSAKIEQGTYFVDVQRSSSRYSRFPVECSCLAGDYVSRIKSRWLELVTLFVVGLTEIAN